MRVIYTAFVSLFLLGATALQVYATAEQPIGPTEQGNGAAASVQEEGTQQEREFDKKRKEQESIELENALNKARLEKELAALEAEVRRLILEKEAMALRWEIEEGKNQKAHAKDMRLLNQEKERLRAEVAISQAKVDQAIEKFNLSATNLHLKVSLLKMETEQFRAEVKQYDARKKRATYADGGPVYLDEPLQKDGSLVISDRRIELNGVISDWKANYVTDRIQYFNNKDNTKPIFIVISSSPGGSVLAGWCILKAMEHSQAPVHVVVKSFAASMAAFITTLAAKSYAYPNAIVLHHQMSMYMSGGYNVREQGEIAEDIKKYWARLGGRLAKKMGISLTNLDKKLYEKSVGGDWSEFADDAKKLKWVDNIITGIQESDVREMPDAADYTWLKHIQEYYGLESPATNVTNGDNAVVYLPPLGPKDFYYLYNPDNRYQVRLSK